MQRCQLVRAQSTARPVQGLPWRKRLSAPQSPPPLQQMPEMQHLLDQRGGVWRELEHVPGVFPHAGGGSKQANENALKEYLEKKARLTVQKRDVRKKDEMELKAFLEQMPGLEIVVHDNAVMGADSACPGAKLRPDFQVSSRAIREHLSLWVECDEDAHRGPEYSCELARIWKMYSAVMWKYRVHVVRWNPHAFATGFKTSREKFPKARRYEILEQELDRIIKEAQEQPPDFLLKITYICYDCSCGSADACGFVHHRTYMSEEEVKGDLERGW